MRLETEASSALAGHGALGDHRVAVHRHDAFFDQLRQDPRRIEPSQPTHRVQVLEAHHPVDLGEHESGPRIEVQPDDLVRRQRHPRHAIHRAELALVHLDEVLLADRGEPQRLGIVGLAREDLGKQFERPGEVVEGDELAGTQGPRAHLLVLRGRGGQRLVVDAPCRALLFLGLRGRLRQGHRRALVPRSRARWVGGRRRRRRPGRGPGRRRHVAEPGMRSGRERLGGLAGTHVRVDPLEGAAEELAGAQIGGLEPIRLLLCPYPLHHLALAVVVEALEQQRREPPAAALAGRNRHWPPPRGEVRPRSSAPLRAPSMRSRRSTEAARPSLSLFETCSLATLIAALARCRGSMPSPLAAAFSSRGQSSSNCLKSCSAFSLRAAHSGGSFWPSIHSSLALAAVAISSSVRPEEAVTVMLCLRPVCTSMAETETMPSAEMSKMTSMSTSPRLALRSPVIMNSPSSSFWAAISLSPCSTVIFAEV